MIGMMGCEKAESLSFYGSFMVLQLPTVHAIWEFVSAQRPVT